MIIESVADRNIRYVCFVFLLALLGACAIPLQPEVQRRLEDQHQLVKNYVIGQSMTVNVGDPMIKFQDFWLETTESSVAIPDKTVNLKVGGVRSIEVTLVAGQKYPVRGRISIDGMDYMVVGAPEPPGEYRAVLVKPDRTLHNGLAVAGPPYLSGLVLTPYTVTISDPAAKIIRETIQNVKSSRGYENFEILYTGTNSNGLNLTYREFSPEGIARVAFFQNLTYEVGAKIITFKKYRIAVEHASSESITFTVLADGQ